MITSAKIAVVPTVAELRFLAALEIGVGIETGMSFDITAKVKILTNDCGANGVGRYPTMIRTVPHAVVPSRGGFRRGACTAGRDRRWRL